MSFPYLEANTINVNHAYTFPVNSGSVNQLLVNEGSGSTAWVDAVDVATLTLDTASNPSKQLVTFYDTTGETTTLHTAPAVTIDPSTGIIFAEDFMSLTTPTLTAGATFAVSATVVSRGLIVNTADPSTWTLCTGTDLTAALNPDTIGQTFSCSVCNQVNGTLTINGNTDMAIVGPATISRGLELKYRYVGGVDWVCYMV